MLIPASVDLFCFGIKTLQSEKYGKESGSDDAERYRWRMDFPTSLILVLRVASPIADRVQLFHGSVAARTGGAVGRYQEYVLWMWRNNAVGCACFDSLFANNLNMKTDVIACISFCCSFGPIFFFLDRGPRTTSSRRH
jgi:hypothetical protein